jgi:hypothetical protein
MRLFTKLNPSAVGSLITIGPCMLLNDFNNVEFMHFDSDIYEAFKKTDTIVCNGWTNKKWINVLSLYREARKQGIQPE